jgi:hypothetical protein
MSLRTLIASFWRRLPTKNADFTNLMFVNSMSDIPTNVGKTIFVVGSKPKWVIFACPCRRGHRLSIPLMKSVSPHWRLTKHGKTISLWPSVYVAGNPCGSHFWLLKNRVEWARWAHEK